MTQKEIRLLLQYALAERTFMEREFRQLRSNIRYRDIDIMDCLELLLLLQRIETFNHVFNDIYLLLNLRKYTDFEENII